MTGEAKEPRGNRGKTAGGLCIPGGLLLGMGVGWAMGHLVQGVLAGLGFGFLLFAIVLIAVRD